MLENQIGEYVNNNSRKAKSRYLQNIVKDRVIRLFKLPPGAVRTSNTGENGEDLKLLSLTALPFLNMYSQA